MILKKSWIAGLIFANLPKICEFAGIILAKNQRGYILIIKSNTLKSSLLFNSISWVYFYFHSWNKPLTPDTLSSSVNNSEKKIPGFINCIINFCNSTSSVWFCEISFCEFVKNSRKINLARDSPALLSTNKVVLPWNIVYDWL